MCDRAQAFYKNSDLPQKSIALQTLKVSTKCPSRKDNPYNSKTDAQSLVKAWSKLGQSLASSLILKLGQS
jgi:hypothetical protein